MIKEQTQQRVEWVDIAKGVAILLVAVHHTVLFLDGYGWLPDLVTWVNRQLGTFRMPLFFLASGIFAGRTLSSSWAVVLRKRVLFFGYLYAVWVVIRFVFFRFVPNVTNPEEGHRPLDLLESLVVPQTGLWFLYALAVFSLVTKAVWWVPVPVQLGVAALMSAAVGGQLIRIGSFAWSNMAMFLVFFLLGCRCRPAIDAAVARLTLVRAGLLVAVYAVVLGTLAVLDLGRVPGVRLLASLVAVTAGVAFAVAISGSPIGHPLCALGRRTIDVYLPHVMVIGGLTAALARFTDLSDTAGLGMLFVLAAVAVCGSLVLSSALRRMGATWLFVLPTLLSRPRVGPLPR